MAREEQITIKCWPAPDLRMHPGPRSMFNWFHLTTRATHNNALNRTLRLTSTSDGPPEGAPGVKLAASEKGSGLGLSNGQRLPDGRSAGIQLHADDPVVVLIDSQGRERVLKP